MRSAVYQTAALEAGAVGMGALVTFSLFDLSGIGEALQQHPPSPTYPAPCSCAQWSAAGAGVLALSGLYVSAA